MKPEPPPPRIASPCPKQWEGMSGDDQRRFCDQCQLHVHNLSAMSRGERAQFLAGAGEHSCVTYELRPDGTMVTPTRWSWLWSPLQRVQWAAAALLATLFPFLFSACVTRRTTGAPLPSNQSSVRLTGDICPPSTPRPSVPERTMGKPNLPHQPIVLGRLKTTPPN